MHDPIYNIHHSDDWDPALLRFARASFELTRLAKGDPQM